MRRLAVAAALSALVLAGCSSTSGGDASSSAPATPASVVIVSGLAATSPYTTPDAACQTGFAAGNTDTYMREQLLAAGFDVYTAPAMVGGGQVTDQAAEGGPFGGCPPQPPAEVTVNPIVDPLRDGRVLAGFLRWLKAEEGVDEVHIVGHSMGGIFSRVAIADLKAAGDGPRVLSLTTVGSPWEPIMIGSFEPGQDPATACDGNEACLAFQGPLLQVPTIVDEILPFVQKEELPGWTQEQAGVLDGIPATLIGGTYFTKEGGSSERWPNDAVVQIDAALARSVSDDVLPHRTCHSFPDTHSLGVSAVVGEAEETALTWDPRTTQAIIDGINAAPTALQGDNRVGCPTP